MKKNLLVLFSIVLFVGFSTTRLAAQDEKPARVTLTITENDKVTTDTTFEIGEARGGDKLVVVKDKGGKITVSEPGEEDHPISHEDCKHGKHKKVMVMKSAAEGHHKIDIDDCHTMVITEEEVEEGKTSITVKSFGPDEEVGMEKIIKVHVEKGEECEGKKENIEVYVIKDIDKDVKTVNKKIRVEIEDMDEEDDEDTETEKKEK
jgi:hypothetical protein